MRLLDKLFRKFYPGANQSTQVANHVVPQVVAPKPITLIDILDSSPSEFVESEEEIVQLRYHVIAACPELGHGATAAYSSVPLQFDGDYIVPSVLKGKSVVTNKWGKNEELQLTLYVKPSEIAKAGYSLEEFVTLMRNNSYRNFKREGNCCYANMSILVKNANSKRFRFDILNEIKEVKDKGKILENLQYLADRYEEIGQIKIANELTKHKTNLKLDNLAVRERPLKLNEFDVARGAIYTSSSRPSFLPGDKYDLLIETTQEVVDKVNKSGIRSLTKNEYGVYNHLLRALVGYKSQVNRVEPRGAK